MDCFYAAVEMRDDPALHGQAVAVGGRPDSRGVIATCNYEARRYGVHSALSSAVAKQRCPHLIFVKPRMDHYRDISQLIRKIFYQYTDQVEPLSLDEAFLDVSDSDAFQGSATFIAQAICNQIQQQTKLTASAGVAPNKFLAKIASDWHKPNGIKVITPKEIDSFVRRLPVKKIPGVGKVTASKLADMGIYLCDDLRRLSQQQLDKSFGSFGKRLYELSRGIDKREVASSSERKSVSVETTFEQDLATADDCIEQLAKLLEQLNHRLSKSHSHRLVRKLHVKLKFNDFTATSIERTSPCVDHHMFEQLIRLAWQRQQKPVRLIGIGTKLAAQKAQVPEMEQLELTLKLQQQNKRGN
jgi:DNA polymerase IV